jgi:ferredoxin
MAVTGRAAAWLNLAWRFGRHVLVQMPLRAMRGSDDMRRFSDAVLPEGYAPLLLAERELLPAAMRCINCGLCSIICPTLREAPAAAWSETWTFVAGPSRSIDRAALAAAASAPCAECDACAAVCPTGVPIPQLAALVRRVGTATTPSTTTAA